MSTYDFSAQRLFVESDLTAGCSVSCNRDQTNYLVNVLRLKAGDTILLFNGREGEWQAHISEVSKRECTLRVDKLVRPQSVGQDLLYLFAPLKRARIDYMVQKATEMGVSALQPVMTHRTQNARVNVSRLQANVIEAAEQCGILNIPRVEEPKKLDAVLRDWTSERHLIYCDENAPITSPMDALSEIPSGPLAVLIGPEGGFSEQERAELNSKSFVTTLSLGPRIMRADTAAVAALALVNATLGDWRENEKN